MKIPFFGFFRKRTPEEVCVRAYQLFLKEIQVEEIVAHLCAEGFSEYRAARAVTFLPSAFARVHYQKEGLSFPDLFYPGAKAYREGKTLRYADEPIFNAAVRLAEQLKRDGDWHQVWRFIEISSEYASVTKAREQGLTPTSFAFFIYEF